MVEDQRGQGGGGEGNPIFFFFKSWIFFLSLKILLKKILYIYIYEMAK